MKKNTKWIPVFLTVFSTALVLAGALSVYVDPYLHYHSPRTDRFYYTLDSERYTDNGILRNLSYDAVIVGSSMTENFRTSLLDGLFFCQSVKVPSAGASWYEASELVNTALRYQPELRLVIRGLDMDHHMDEAPEALDYGLGIFPTYLYNDDPVDDLYYILNRDVLYGSAQAVLAALRGTEPGITSMDDYGAWGSEYRYGKTNALCREAPYADAPQQPLTQERIDRVLYNAREKLLRPALEHPQTQFYYFLTPYSAAWWGDLRQNGQLEAQLEMEALVLSQLVSCENIHIFSWNAQEELVLDLANYKDRIHYGPWVNDWILEEMAAESGRLTQENLEDYLSRERSLYENFDFNTLFRQTDPEEGYIPEFFRK